MSAESSAHSPAFSEVLSELSHEANALSSETTVASQPFVGRWNKLVSTTNWEKGRIISEWREALITSGAAVAEYADDAWAQLVGGVTGQHVGRLRRVHQRFADTYTRYAGLFWSHFQAAVEWEDAEMWLQGAVGSDWSVADMRRQRWETLGKLPDLEPVEEEVSAIDREEDFASPRETAPSRFDEERAGPTYEGPDFGDESNGSSSISTLESHADSSPVETGDFLPTIRPFASLPQLPDDVSDAFESFKLALLRHKTSGWSEITRDDFLSVLESLKQLALAPAAENTAPF